MASLYNPLPPITQISLSDEGMEDNAWESVLKTVGDGASVEEITRLRRLGRGLPPIDSHVFRPIITVEFAVNLRKNFMSAGLRSNKNTGWEFPWERVVCSDSGI